MSRKYLLEYPKWYQPGKPVVRIDEIEKLRDEVSKKLDIRVQYVFYAHMVKKIEAADARRAKVLVILPAKMLSFSGCITCSKAAPTGSLLTNGV